MQQLPQVLLVEDDRNIAGALTHALSNTYAVDAVASGRRALHKIKSQNYRAIVLDLNLPDINGLAICQRLRDKGITTPILILTGDASVITKITLLDAGANDYLTKPFSLGECKARLRALIRNHAAELSGRSNQLCAYGVTLSRATNQVSRDGQIVILRRKEFALLECLIENAGSVVSRNQLSHHAWPGEDFLWTNTLEVHIKQLRDKLDKPFTAPLIHTVHGLGYKLELKPAKLPKATSV